MENEKKDFVEAEGTTVDEQQNAATEPKNEAADTKAKKPNVFKKALDYLWDHKGSILKAGALTVAGIGLFAAGRKFERIEASANSDVKQLGYDGDDDDSDYSEDDVTPDYDETENDDEVAEDYTEEAV